MSDDTQIAKIGNNLPQPGRPQQPIQANLNQYGNDSTQIAYDVMKVFYNMGNGVRQGLNYSEFSRLMVFEPSYDEQVAIADHLDAKCAEIDDTIAQKQEQLSTLEAYKKSLIYEYVTGKKEVSCGE